MLSDILMSCAKSVRNWVFVQISIDMLSRVRDLAIFWEFLCIHSIWPWVWGLSQPVAEEPGYGMEIEQTKQAQLQGTLPTEGEGTAHTQM